MTEMMKRGQELDAVIGRRVAADVCKAFMAEVAQRNPALKGQLARFIAQNEGPGGVPVRRRSDTKYSRVGVEYDALGILQAQDPGALFGVQIGGTDVVLGQLTEVDTNVISAGKQTSNEMFKAHAIGFTLQLVDLGTGAINQDEIADLWRAILENCSAVLTVGTQNRQRFPWLSAYPGLAAGFESSGAVTVAAQRQGRQALMPLDPPVFLGAGESYSIELKLKRATSNGINLINSGLTFANVKFSIACVMYGKSYTGIPG